MSELTRIKELRKEIESLCGNCDRPDKEQLGEIILSSMALGFSYGIEADRPQGEWIEVDDSLISCKCSICGWESHMHEDDVYGMPYCPNCGARMKGTDDE